MGALVLSRLVFVKELGLGVAFAVLLDATVVRAVLVPALMRLLGPVAWWSPWSSHQVRRPVSVPVVPKRAGRTRRRPHRRSLSSQVGPDSHMTTFRPFSDPAPGE